MLVFILIELLLYPVTLLGLLLFMLVILCINRPQGISGTAYEPLTFDHLSAGLIEAIPPYKFLGRLLPLGMQLTCGEKFRSGIPMQPSAAEALAAFLAAHHMELLRFESIGDESIYGSGLARAMCARQFAANDRSSDIA